MRNIAQIPFELRVLTTGNRSSLRCEYAPAAVHQFDAVRYTELRDFTGSRVDAENSSGDDVRATEQPTRMHTDCRAEVITG